MKTLTNIKLICVPIYVFIYNLQLSFILQNFFQSENILLEYLNIVIFLYTPIFILLSLGKSNKLKLVNFDKIKYKTIFLGVLFVVSFSIFFTLFEIKQQLKIFDIYEILEVTNNNSIIFELFSAAILAPIFEEITTKVLLFDSVKKVYPKYYIFILTIQFALTHVGQILESPIRLPFYFIISLFLNLIYDKNRNLLFNIALHAIYNLVATLVFHYFYFLPIDSIYVATLFLSISLFYGLLKKN